MYLIQDNIYNLLTEDEIKEISAQFQHIDTDESKRYCYSLLYDSRTYRLENLEIK